MERLTLLCMVFVSVFMLSFTPPAQALPGDLDPAFGTGGLVLTNFGLGDNTEDSARDVVIQSDGKIVAAGRLSDGETDNFALVRYNADGTLDDTFGTGGIVITDFGGNSDDEAFAIALQSDGK